VIQLPRISGAFSFRIQPEFEKFKFPLGWGILRSLLKENRLSGPGIHPEISSRYRPLLKSNNLWTSLWKTLEKHARFVDNPEKCG
jgi:hypothetical protein